MSARAARQATRNRPAWTKLLCLLILLAVFLSAAWYIEAPLWTYVVATAIVVVGVWRLDWGLAVLALSYSFALPVIRTPLAWSAFIRADDIAIVAVLTGWLLARRGRVRDLLPQSPLTRPLLAWLALLTISLGVGFALHGGQRAFLMGLLALIRTIEFALAYLIVVTSVRSAQQAEGLLKALWIGALGVSGFSVFMWTIGACIPLEGWARAVAPNTSVLNDNYVHHGVYMLLAVMLLEAMVLRERSTRLKALLVASVGIGAFALALSTSRTAYVGFAAASVVAAVLWSGLLRPRVGLPAAILPLCLLASAVVLLPPRQTVDIAKRYAQLSQRLAPAIAAAPGPDEPTPQSVQVAQVPRGIRALPAAQFEIDAMRDQTRVAPAARVAKTGRERSMDVDFSRRSYTWRTTLSQLRHQPWRIVTGVGFLRFRFSNLGGQMLSGHNNYIHVLAELGVPGIVVVFWGAWNLLAFLLNAARRAPDRRGAVLASGLLAACIGLGVTALVQETFYPHRALSSFGGYFLFVMGVGVAALSSPVDAAGPGSGAGETGGRPETIC